MRKFLAVSFGQVSLDAVAALAQNIRHASAVVVAVCGLAQQAKVAVGGGEQILGWNLVNPADGVVIGPTPERAPPGFDNLANEVDSALDRLQDGLARVEAGGQFLSQQCLYTYLGFI